MLTIAICEDDKMQQQEIEKYVRSLFMDEPIDIDVYDSGEDLLAGYKCGKKYSVILLDMQMKELDGIQTAKAIKEYDRHGTIIIITSVMEYAVKGYSVGAYEFILKPVNEKKLHHVLSQAIKEIQIRMNKSYLIKTRERTAVLKFSEVIYIESYKKKIIVHTELDDYENNENISSAERKLCSDGFVRISRFYLVNVHHICEIGVKEVLVSSGERLVYSDKYTDKIKRNYMAYLMGDM